MHFDRVTKLIVGQRAVDLTGHGINLAGHHPRGHFQIKLGELTFETAFGALVDLAGKAPGPVWPTFVLKFFLAQEAHVDQRWRSATLASIALFT